MIKKLLIVLTTLFILASCNSSKTQSDPNIDLTAQNGKKTFVGFVATWCPHCQEEVPILEKFYKDHKNDVNMQLMVVDGKRFIGDYTIPQDSSNSLTYEQATGEACDLVPSYVIYDENKTIVEKKCGAKLTYDDLSAKLLSNNNTDSMNTNSGNTNTGSTNTGTTNTGSVKDTSYQLAPLKDNDLVATLTTSNGTIKIKLFPEDAPLAVTSFIGLAKKGYYNGTIFHRVIKNFMIQGGDPQGTGTGGVSFYGKEFKDEFSSKLSNLTGSLSMANSGKNTNGSQFFINQVPNTYLDGKHTVFGQVVEGMGNVDKIASVKTGANDKPEKEVKLIKVEIGQYMSGSIKDYKFDSASALKKIEDEEKKKKEANKNREVKVGDEIELNYILKITSTGVEYSNSYKAGEPLKVKVGDNTLIPGFEKGILGMKIGEKKTLKLKASEAYGEYKASNLQEIPRAQLKDFEDHGIELKVGNKLPTNYGEFEIKEVTKDTVKVDLNHPLAGKDLTFDVEIVGFDN